MSKNISIESIVAKANEVMKNNAKARKAWNASYYSLSKLLRDAQMKSQMELTTPVFESIGLATNGKVKPSEVLAMLHDSQKKAEKDGSVSVLLWSRVQVHDKETKEPLFEEDGVTPIMEDKCSRIKEGAWTLNKLCRLMAQRNAFFAE